MNAQYLFTSVIYIHSFQECGKYALSCSVKTFSIIGQSNELSLNNMSDTYSDLRNLLMDLLSILSCDIPPSCEG